MLSVRLHLSVLKEIRKCMTALGVLWFPAGLFHSGYLTMAIKTKTCYEFVFNVVTQSSAVSLSALLSGWRVFCLPLI